jgi:hypothetical protein
MEDAWYELEGAYEVYGVGRCRFVLVHCRNALIIGLHTLAKRLHVLGSKDVIEGLNEKVGMPENILTSCRMIDLAGRYGPVLKARSNDQEYAAMILSRTVEALDWIRGEVSKE